MADATEVLEVSAQLHHLLGDLTTGEANAMVRRSRGENGLLAWRKLASNANPKTLASGLKCVNSVHNPPRIAEVRQMDICIEEWEARLGKLNLEYGEVLTSKVRLPLLYGMLPREVQEKVLDRCRIQWSSLRDDDVTRTVQSVIKEFKELAKARGDQCVPTPMDVSAVAGDDTADAHPSGGEDDWFQHDDWQDIEVQAVYKGAGKGVKGKSKGKSCFNCGGAFCSRVSQGQRKRESESHFVRRNSMGYLQRFRQGRIRHKSCPESLLCLWRFGPCHRKLPANATSPSDTSLQYTGPRSFVHR